MAAAWVAYGPTRTASRPLSHDVEPGDGLLHGIGVDAEGARHQRDTGAIGVHTPPDRSSLDGNERVYWQDRRVGSINPTLRHGTPRAGPRAMGERAQPQQSARQALN